MGPRFLCDTNCLVAAICSWHEHHESSRAELERRRSAGEELVLAAHSLAEAYAVLTRLPAPHRLRSEDALALLEANWGEAPAIALTGRETWNAVRESRRRGLIGGQVYDGLIASSAKKAGASTLVTWNHRRFERFADELEIAIPRRL